jgi:rubrerythrin
MTQGRLSAGEGSGADYVRFWPAGQPAKGEFHCSECGYGVAVYRELPRCPMCGGEAWEQAGWSPFSRALDAFRG